MQKSDICVYVRIPADYHYRFTQHSSNVVMAHMIGSPTRLKAACLGVLASSNRSGLTPGMPLSCLMSLSFSANAPSTISFGASATQRKDVPTGFYIRLRSQNCPCMIDGRFTVCERQPVVYYRMRCYIKGELITYKMCIYSHTLEREWFP